MPTWSFEVASRPMFSADPSGDVHLVEPCEGGLLVAAIDGGGHGIEAREAAEVALTAMRGAKSPDLAAVLSAAHEAMRGTPRGAATAVCFIAPGGHELTWCSAGNVAAVVFRAGKKAKELARRQGSLGIHLPRTETERVPLLLGDVIVLATDGVERRFADGALPPGDDPKATAAELLARYRKSGDDALVLVGVSA